MSNKSATVATMGIDIGKNSLDVVGLDETRRNRAAAEVVESAGRSEGREYSAMSDRRGGVRW